MNFSSRDCLRPSSLLKENEPSFFIGSVVSKSQGSRTAQSMAMFRALESARPEKDRRFADPFAALFLNRSMRLAVRAAETSATAHSALITFIDMRWPGARRSGVARTAYIDQLLREALRSGAEQVVILGAGYDSRAYRIEEMKLVRVFEVDRADTQRLKRERLVRIPGLPSQHVIFVEMDFLRQTVQEALASFGFQSQRRTFFIWEGVTHYLDSDAVDATMRFVASSSESSEIVFTYIHRGLLDGSGAMSVDPNVVHLLQEAGEPWKFGFYPAELPQYLRTRGLRLIEDLSAIEYGERFLGATEEQMKGYEFYHVALAGVNRREV